MASGKGGIVETETTVQPNRFAQRLNELFASHLSPYGREYTLTEVSNATDSRVSVAYLSLLRKGGVSRPRVDKLEVIASFFKVPLTFFTQTGADDGSDAEALSSELQAALAKPGVREVALRAGELGENERKLLLQMLDYSRTVAEQARTTERALAGD